MLISFERGIPAYEQHGGHLLRWLYLRVTPLRSALRALLGSRLVRYSQSPEVLKVVNINPLLRVGAWGREEEEEEEEEEEHGEQGC